MSIGSQRLDPAHFGFDRDSGIVLHIANENNEAVQKAHCGNLLKKCKDKNDIIGICGQAPSDYPGFCEISGQRGIESMSSNPDTVIKNYHGA